MEESLVLLYTADLRGDLDRLPRLYTFLRQLKAAPLDDETGEVLLCPTEPAPVRHLFLDLGHACAPEVWHCAVTGGRSVLIVLDAMGYAAANVTGMLTTGDRARLVANLLGLALVDPAHPAEQGGIRFVAGTSQPAEPSGLTIVLDPASSTALNGRTLFLAPVESGQVGMAHVRVGSGEPALLARAVFDLPPNTPPDPTITGTVEFVLSEARRYRTRHDS